MEVLTMHNEEQKGIFGRKYATRTQQLIAKNQSQRATDIHGYYRFAVCGVLAVILLAAGFGILSYFYPFNNPVPEINVNVVPK